MKHHDVEQHEGESIGAELVEPALHKKEEKEISRHMEELAALSPNVIEHSRDTLVIERVPDRDLEFERKILEISHKGSDADILLSHQDSVGHSKNYPPKESSLSKEELRDLPESFD